MLLPHPVDIQMRSLAICEPKGSKDWKHLITNEAFLMEKGWVVDETAEPVKYKTKNSNVWHKLSEQKAAWVWTSTGGKCPPKLLY